MKLKYVFTTLNNLGMDLGYSVSLNSLPLIHMDGCKTILLLYLCQFITFFDPVPHFHPLSNVFVMYYESVCTLVGCGVVPCVTVA